MKTISIFSKDIITINCIAEDIQKFGNFLFTKKVDSLLNLIQLDVSYSSTSELQDILNVCDDAGDSELFTEF